MVGNRLSDTVLTALIASLAPTLTVLLTWWRGRRKLRQIHDLVNSQHTAAIAKIEQLRSVIAAIIQEEEEHK